MKKRKNLYDTFTLSAERNRDKTALIVDDLRRSYSYGELDDLIVRTAEALSRCGIRSGMRVGMMLNGTVEEASVWLALNKIGVVSRFIDYLKDVDYLTHCIASSRLDVLIMDEILLPAEPVFNPDELPVIVVTSNRFIRGGKYISLNVLLEAAEKGETVSLFEKSMRASEDSGSGAQETHGTGRQAVGGVDMSQAPSAAGGPVTTIINSSGTTGTPKPIALTDAAIEAAAAKVLRTDLLSRDSVVLKVIPIQVGLGLITTLYTSLINGNTVILDRGESNKALPANTVRLDGTLKLIDFGAARELESGDRTHSAIYTRGYSAPEQRDEKGVLGSWTDVYGLCSLFWFCLTGRDPEDAQSRMIYDELEKPSSLGGKISPAAEELLMRGLELDSSARIRDVETLRRALERLYPSLTEEQKRQKEARKRRLLRTAAIAGGFLLLIACCLVFIFRTRILFHFIDTQVVALNGSQMTPEEYADSSAKVRERVEALTGKGRYLWKEEEDQHIIFEVPKASFGDVDPEYYAKLMLTRPMIMRVYVELPEGSAQTEHETGAGTGSHDETVSAEDTDESAEDGSALAISYENNVGTVAAGETNDDTAAQPAPAAGEENDDAAAWANLPLSEEKRIDGKKPGDIVSVLFDQGKSYRYLGIFRQDRTILDIREASGGDVLIFQDEAAASLGNLLSGEGQHFLFSFDEFFPDGNRRMEYSFGSGYSVGDGKSVFLPKEDHIGGQSMFAPLALAKLQYGEAPSAAAFPVQCRPEVRWENPETALLSGKNQTGAERIKPPCIQLQYKPGSSLTAGEADGYTSALLSIHAVMKNRLDSLGIPYAVGSDPEDSQKVFVQIPLETGLWREELENLGADLANQYHLGGPRTMQSDSFYGSSFSVRKTGEDSWQILMSPGKSDQSTAEKALQSLVKQGAEEVFLYDGVRPIAAGNLQEAVRSLGESGTIAFTRWTFSEYQAMDTSTLSLGRFIATCFEQDPEEDYRLVRTQVKEADGRTRYFMEGLPDQINIDPGEKWAADQEAGDNIELTYYISLRNLSISMYDYPLDQPERCLVAVRDLLESARKMGVVLNEININCYEKPKDTAFRWMDSA